MMRYLVQRDYRAGDVAYQAGAIIEITDPEYAAWLLRDMMGHLAPVVDAPPVSEPEPVVVAEPVTPPKRARRAKKTEAA